MHMSQLRYNPLRGIWVEILQSSSLPTLLPMEKTGIPQKEELSPFASVEGLFRLQCEQLFMESIPCPEGLSAQVLVQAAQRDNTICFLYQRGADLLLMGNTQIDTVASEELKRQSEYYKRKGSLLLHDYAMNEMGQGKRIVAENEQFLAVVPYWSESAYEILILPRFEKMHTLLDIDELLLASLIRKTEALYDKLCGSPCGYMLALYQSPQQSSSFHIHIVPSIKKNMQFCQGYEILVRHCVSITAEQAALFLQEGKNGNNHSN